MNVRTTTDPAATTDADTLVVAGDGKRGKLSVRQEGDRQRLTVGLGDADTRDKRAWYEVTAAVTGRLAELGTTHLAWDVEDDAQAAAVAEGMLLASYRLTAYKSKQDDETPSLETLTIAGSGGDTVQRAVTVAAAVNRARDLQNGPPNVITPTYLGERAQAIAAGHATVTAEVGGLDHILELGMGAFASVTQGSDTPPALIVLRYESPDAPADAPLLAFVGKGVTFDSGGLSIKPAGSMVTMKSDMSGSAAVLEATAAIAELSLPIRLLTIIGSTENTINGSALKVGDVVTAANGLTIEIDNTDAEGRLVLADCLHHAVQLGADRIVDVATLTGAMAVALGTAYVGYYASDEALAQDVAAAGAAGGEPLWRMPLDQRYGELMRGTIADLTNAAIGKGGGACSAAGFLQRFVDDVPWAHFDIAGTAYNADEPFAKKGGTGAMVRTLVALAAAES